MDYFLNPRNVGEIEDADAVAEVGNITCGDALKLYLKLDENGRISDAKFKTFGCVSAIASSSALTELIKGKTLDEAAKITNQDIVAVLGNLPQEKMHCSVMGMEALEAAIANYRGEKAEKRVITGAERIVCKCFGVTEAVILKAIKVNGLKTVEQVTDFTKAGGGCGQCKGEIEKILKDYWANAENKKFADMTVVEKIKAIEKVLEEKVNPLLKKDGGWIELVDVQGFAVKLRFLGMCSGCGSAAITLKTVVEKALKENIDKEIEVEQA
jgi:NifU-like protein